MRDIERELRALPRPVPSPELDARIERLAVTAPQKTRQPATQRRQTFSLIRAAALVLIGLVVGRMTAPFGAGTDTTVAVNGDPQHDSATSEDTPSIEPRIPETPRAADEPPLFAAVNVKQLLTRVPNVQQSGGLSPPPFVLPQSAHNEPNLIPVPTSD